MSGAHAIQAVLDFIDAHLKEELSAAAIARVAGYSVHHFGRLFSGAVGMPVMAYVTYRRLTFAECDLARGGKVTDVAMEYGFETHAGFTKAFKRRFGYPPSLCFLRAQPAPPGRMTPGTLKRQIKGGSCMTPHILELSPFAAVGYPERHRMPHVRRTADIPAFWNDIRANYAEQLTHLHAAFPRSKHFEVGVCYGIDSDAGEFTYLLGKGIDSPADLESIEPGMNKFDVPGGLYAIFSTPPADGYLPVIEDIWRRIFADWLPGSEFELDESRPDFEYYDYRDHGWYFGGKEQMDICIPIRQKEADMRAAKLRLKCQSESMG